MALSGWLGLFLLVSLASAVRPKPWSSLQLGVKGGNAAQAKWGYNSYNNDDDDDNKMPNGFPKLSQSTKRKLETCVIDPYMDDEFDDSCKNNAYAGLLRLCFHDCATSDPTQADPLARAGCGAWMTKKCDRTKGEQCEWVNQDNAGLQMWASSLNAAYDTAKIDGKNLKSYLSRPDFWQLACNRAIRKASGWLTYPDYYAGRPDQLALYPEPGPSFPGRLPDAHSLDDYKSLCGRNQMAPEKCLALLTAHSLGQAHVTATGYRGAFDSSPKDLDNEFWKGLWKLQWFSQSVDSFDVDGNPRTKLQFALSTPNDKVSLLLPSDLNILWDINTCSWETDPWALVQGKCAFTPAVPTFKDLVKSWVDSNQKALDDFSASWVVMSQWGCTNCYKVDHIHDYYSCSQYNHNCQRGYTENPAYWKPGWSTPGPGPSRSPTSTPGGSNQGTTTKVPYGQTTTTTRAPTTTKVPYGQTTTAAPTTTTRPPTTTATTTTRPPATTTKTPYGQTTTARPTTTPLQTTPTPTPTTTTPTPVPTTTPTQTPETTIIVTRTRSPDTQTPSPTPTTTPETTTTPIPTTTTEVPTTTTTEAPTTTTTEAPTTTTTTPVPTTTTEAPTTTTTTPVPTTTTTTPVPTTTTTTAPTTTNNYYYDDTTTPLPTTTTQAPTTTTEAPTTTPTTTTPIPTTTTTEAPTTTTTEAPTTTPTTTPIPTTTTTQAPTTTPTTTPIPTTTPRPTTTTPRPTSTTPRPNYYIEKQQPSL